ncbi:MAG: FAD-dependent oxidoreductase [Candidatus Omnitrophica bacterium]|nr:FAD-dependent oxidoreductase [Candidatus Omnitrophota bacterium]
MPQERIRALSPAKRVRTFEEVRLGLKKGEAIENAKIFLERERSVKGSGCPLGTSYFDVLRLLAKGDCSGAYEKLLETNPLPGITGRVASDPYEVTQVYNRQGQRISLRGIERFLDDMIPAGKADLSSRRGRQKIAIVGSGVSGLSAASWLVRAGHSVTVLESAHVLGGSLSYAYGEFSIPERALRVLLERLRVQGVQFMSNTLVGRAPTLVELADEKGFSAVLLATGSGMVKPLLIPGDASAGVLPADEAMKLWRWMRAGQESYTTSAFLGGKVIVVGSGTIAFEVARTAVRLGKEVMILVRGAENEIKAPASIVREAFEEGIKIKTFARPVKVEADSSGCVKGLVCHILDYRVDQAGHLNVVDEDDSELLLEAQTIINASGHEPETLVLKGTPGLEFNEQGCVVVKDGGAATTMRKVFAAGRVTNLDFGLVEDILSAKRAAGEIEKFFHS